MKFRKKPVIIEAEDAMTLMANAASNWKQLPKWFVDAIVCGDVFITHKIIHIITPEGIMRAYAGDMVICGVKGELYPCKKEIFELTYEPV